MFSKEIKEKVIIDFLQSGFTYKYFCEQHDYNLNIKTLGAWVREYRLKNNLTKKDTIGKNKVNKEPVSMFCYDVDAIKTTAPVVSAPAPPVIPNQVKQTSIFNITDKIQFQSDILNTYKDLTDVKYSDNNVILLKKIRGLCNEFTV